MPAVNINMPRDFFTPAEKKAFIAAVKQSLATHMDAYDPVKKTMTTYGENPDGFIDLFLFPYDEDDASSTTPFVATIVTYAWEARVVDMPTRLEHLLDDIRPLLASKIPPPQEAISFTFLGKQLGCWAAR